jgi:hypothetical protein
MTWVKPDFKRILLKLPYSRQDYAAVRLIAAFAELPNTREFRGGTWQPLNPEQLGQDATFAAREAERLFLENAGHYRPKLLFHTAAGPAPRDADIEDIIALIQPMKAIERATHQFSESLEAAFRSAASILLIPNLAKQQSGPIIAIANGSDDSSVATALAVAASSRERLILIPSEPGMSLSPMLEKARTAGVAASLAEAVFHGGNILLPASVKGRLLVMSRKRALERPAFAETPVLLVTSASPQGVGPD